MCTHLGWESGFVLQGNVFIKSCKSEGHVLNGLTFMFLGEGHTTESLGKFLRKKAFCAALFCKGMYLSSHASRKAMF